MATQSGGEVASLNDTLAGIGFPFKLAIVPVAKLEFLSKNARYMKQETFKNLVENVKRDGGLSSIPFCWFDGEMYHVLSGNHRAKAAIAAGQTSVLVLYDDRPLTPEQRVAIQLSHNAIAGEDDPVVLKELWNEINDLGLKYYAGLDDAVLQKLETMTLDPMADVRLSFKTLSFAFPEEIDRLQAAFEGALVRIVSSDAAHLVRLREFDRLLDGLDKIKKSKEIKSSATALCLMLDCWEAHGDEWLEEAESKSVKSERAESERVSV